MTKENNTEKQEEEKKKKIGKINTRKQNIGSPFFLI
jgi:hypothetical protein